MTLLAAKLILLLKNLIQKLKLSLLNLLQLRLRPQLQFMNQVIYTLCIFIVLIELVLKYLLEFQLLLLALSRKRMLTW